MKSKPKGNPPQFHGPLSEPLPPLPLSSGLLHRVYEFDPRRGVIDGKLDLLIAHYKIPDTEGKWKALALCLARDFVPGFRERDPERRGRKRKRDSLGLTVYEIVEAVRGSPGRRSKGSKTIAAACLAAWQQGKLKTVLPARSKQKYIADLYRHGRNVSQTYRKLKELKTQWESKVTALLKRNE